MRAGDEVRVVYRKYDGSLHWNSTQRWLGEDEHGCWVGAPAMTQGRRGYEPPITWTEASVQLFPRDAWWTATFNAAPAPIEIYCDVTTVPQWQDGEVTMIDLDLDVVRLRSGAYTYVDDEDEFAQHQVRFGYPADVISSAEQACRWLAGAVAARAEPFDAAARGWFAEV